MQIVSLLVPLTFALLVKSKHYRCSWDPLRGKTPTEAGFARLCDAKSSTFQNGNFVQYNCDLQSWTHADFRIAAWYGERKELEVGE